MLSLGFVTAKVFSVIPMGIKISSVISDFLFAFFLKSSNSLNDGLHLFSVSFSEKKFNNRIVCVEINNQVIIQHIKMSSSSATLF